MKYGRIAYQGAIHPVTKPVPGFALPTDASSKKVNSSGCRR